jgi:putative two-component system response regulator
LIALGHHEKHDGSGYPSGLAGDHIPLFARIVAVADVFDALTSVRPYKPAWEAEDAFEYIRQQRGKHFDPRLVDVFLGMRKEIVAFQQEWREQNPATARS